MAIETLTGTAVFNLRDYGASGKKEQGLSGRAAMLPRSSGISSPWISTSGEIEGGAAQAPPFSLTLLVGCWLLIRIVAADPHLLPSTPLGRD